MKRQTAFSSCATSVHIVGGEEKLGNPAGSQGFLRSNLWIFALSLSFPPSLYLCLRQLFICNAFSKEQASQHYLYKEASNKGFRDLA
jgi:hypothetical protein